MPKVIALAAVLMALAALGACSAASRSQFGPVNDFGPAFTNDRTM